MALDPPEHAIKVREAAALQEQETGSRREHPQPQSARHMTHGETTVHSAESVIRARCRDDARLDDLIEG